MDEKTSVYAACVYDDCFASFPEERYSRWTQ
jgi:hypothetical protein